MDSEPQWPSPDSRGVCRKKDERCKKHFPWDHLLPSVSAFTLPGGDWQKLDSRRFKRTEAPVITGADPDLSPLAGIIPYISCCLLRLPQPQASGGSNTIYPYMRPFNQKVTTHVQQLELWSRDTAFARQGQDPGFSTQHQKTKQMKTTTQAHLDLEEQ